MLLPPDRGPAFDPLPPLATLQREDRFRRRCSNTELVRVPRRQLVATVLRPKWRGWMHHAPVRSRRHDLLVVAATKCPRHEMVRTSIPEFRQALRPTSQRIRRQLSKRTAKQQRRTRATSENDAEIDYGSLWRSVLRQRNGCQRSCQAEVRVSSQPRHAL